MEKLLEKMRYYIFWFFDSFKKHKVCNHLKDIRFVNENYNSKKAQVLIKERSFKILNHAKTTTQFYQKYKDVNNLNEFPVVNKNTLRDNFEKFQSTVFLDNKYNHKVSTSGSTGTPFTTYFDINKKVRNTADTIYFTEKTGFKIGYRLLYIRLWDNQHKRSKLSYWIQNIAHHNIFDLKDVDIEKLIKMLENDKSSKGIIAYASAYDAICQYLDKNNSKPLSCNVKSIIAISEGLSSYAKISIKKHFGVSVVSRYSASEIGILAQQLLDNDNFDINWASYIVEILNFDNDKPVKKGEIGRIVITDLYNYAVPLIRYDTGDIGIVDYDITNKLVFTKVEGRKLDILFNTKGDLITSHVVHKICLYNGIKQYQLIQKGKKEYLFKINATEDFNDEKDLIESYKKFFGEDSVITIEYVDDIPILSSGKRKKVVNLLELDI
ncbi:MAG: CoF synthetase [Flavobacteriaceae bacterium]|nr:CoF synthetase [Flavobacteriaceae bacterium]